MRRRDFIKLVTTSTTGAVLFAGCGSGFNLSGIGNGDPNWKFQFESPVQNTLDVIYGRDNWYATTCQQCGSSCGLIVRVFEGRAKKVEGNPAFPINSGGTCARAQAAVQDVYLPDRIQAPLKASGARGSGSFTMTTWDAALKEFSSDLTAAGSGGTLLISEPPAGGFGLVLNTFASSFGAKQVAFEPDERVVLREAMRRVFNTSMYPTIDLASTNFLVSFSADFLHGWISPAQFAMGYGTFRQGRPDIRGTYYHVGPQLNGTAASADSWLPITPGTEGLVALAMAQYMTTQGLADKTKAASIYAGINLNQYTPDQVASATGISAAQIQDLAKRFANGKPSVAIAGTSAAASTNALFNLTSVLALNVLVGSVNVPGGLILNPNSPFPAGATSVPTGASGLTYRDWTSVIRDMNAGKYKLAIIHGANPAYGLPESSGFAAALGKVGKVVSLATIIDETSQLADLVLPVNHGLEDWGLQIPDPGPGYQTVALQQPVINTLPPEHGHPGFDSRPAGDVLIQAAQGAGKKLPWGTYADAVKASVDALRGLGRGNVSGPDAPTYLVQVQSAGGWWDTGAKATGAAPTAPTKPTPAAPPQFTGDTGTYPLYLLPYPTLTLDYGKGAHVAWMQALPEPISTGVWNTWVELNPNTADHYGVGLGDIVTVRSANGVSRDLPVYVNPAAAPNVVQIPMGQGHSAKPNRYSQFRGVNPLDLVDASKVDTETGALAWAATRVQIVKTGKKVRLARFEGQVPAFQLPGALIIDVIPPRRKQG
ncbi:MAG TPA: molybdopterin-dependent oxidoreductase [Thermomicrobiaceae bacterium]|nr:molybdopterin-dependent oxidoreductase [Thermomicrobiaceae bacterium]